MDVAFTYEKLLPSAKKPLKTLNQEKSSSAMVFYWGIRKKFDQLGVHNMFFSSDYKKEFKALFDDHTLQTDPSIYINITSKAIPSDAPVDGENWFVMINVTINKGQDWEVYRKQAREKIVQVINRSLNTNIEAYIEEEFVMDPVFIEETYSGKAGSIYGNSSNNKYAAFNRHPNFSKDINGLYFAGVTVHPGGGIPLALNSAKIAVECLRKDTKMN
jgi:phytoene dehydrogenase-like protein